MKSFIKTYRGADIYEVEKVDESEGKKLGVKLLAKVSMPQQKNLKSDFIQKADDMEQALEKVERAIDDYLSEHEISSSDA